MEKAPHDIRYHSKDLTWVEKDARKPVKSQYESMRNPLLHHIEGTQHALTACFFPAYR